MQGKKLGSERLSKLPKVTQLIGREPALSDAESWAHFTAPDSFHKACLDGRASPARILKVPFPTERINRDPALESSIWQPGLLGTLRSIGVGDQFPTQSKALSPWRWDLDTENSGRDTHVQTHVCIQAQGRLGKAVQESYDSFRNMSFKSDTL